MYNDSSATPLRSPRNIPLGVMRRHFDNGEIAYCVVGTPYGYLYDITGSVRWWNSASGAYKALRKYKNIHLSGA